MQPIRRYSLPPCPACLHRATSRPAYSNCPLRTHCSRRPVHRLVRRIFPGQFPPLGSCAQNPKHFVQHRPRAGRQTIPPVGPLAAAALSPPIRPPPVRPVLASVFSQNRQRHLLCAAINQKSKRNPPSCIYRTGSNVFLHIDAFYNILLRYSSSLYTLHVCCQPAAAAGRDFRATARNALLVLVQAME
jgi:hypothetical protein